MARETNTESPHSSRGAFVFHLETGEGSRSGRGLDARSNAMLGNKETPWREQQLVWEFVR